MAYRCLVGYRRELFGINEESEDAINGPVRGIDLCQVIRTLAGGKNIITCSQPKDGNEFWGEKEEFNLEVLFVGSSN